MGLRSFRTPFITSLTFVTKRWLLSWWLSLNAHSLFPSSYLALNPPSKIHPSTDMRIAMSVALMSSVHTIWDDVSFFSLPSQISLIVPHNAVIVDICCTSYTFSTVRPLTDNNLWLLIQERFLAVTPVPSIGSS